MTPVAGVHARPNAPRRRRRSCCPRLSAAAAVAIGSSVVTRGRRDRGSTSPDYAGPARARPASAPGAHASADITRNDAGFRVTLDAHGLPALPDRRVLPGVVEERGGHAGTDRHVQLQRRSRHALVGRLAEGVPDDDRDDRIDGRRPGVVGTAACSSAAYAPADSAAWLQTASSNDASSTIANRCRTRDVLVLERRRQHGRHEPEEGPPCEASDPSSALPLGLAAAAAFAVGLTSTGPALVAPAAAAEPVGSAFIANNTLTIVGSNGPDVVALDADATQVQVAFGDDPANVHRFNLADFNAISVSLGNGDDQFTEQSGVLADKTLAVDGGNGNDTIKTGDGSDTIFGGNGDDSVDAGRGNDTVFLGNGKDFFVWNPGEGSDAVDGGNGNEDVMQFNGANVNETMSLSANGSQAVFLRDVANIRMDMNDIEIFNLRALGGVDNVTVNDLEGTSIRHANIDLSGGSGGVTGRPTSSRSTAPTRPTTSTSPHTTVRSTLRASQAETQITGSETLDHLQVNTLDGNDTVTVDPNVSTLIGVAVDLGLGQH